MGEGTTYNIPGTDRTIVSQEYIATVDDAQAYFSALGFPPVAQVDFATLVRVGRAIRGIDQQAFAVLIGVSRQMLSEMEKGETIPLAGKQRGLVKEFGRPFEAILEKRNYFQRERAALIAEQEKALK